MKNNASRLTIYLLPLLLIACGTFEVTLLPNTTLSPQIDATFTPSAIAGPASPVPPSECPPFANETVLPASPDNPQSYINHQYNELNLPEGLTFYGSGVINASHMWLWVGRPDFDMQFVERLICHDVNGRPYSVIVDAIKIPKQEAGYGRATACVPVLSENAIVAYGKYNQTTPEVILAGVQGWKMHDIDFVVSIDSRAGRFDLLPPEGLECVHGSGLGS